jgi:hypothetical protein
MMMLTIDLSDLLKDKINDTIISLRTSINDLESNMDRLRKNGSASNVCDAALINVERRHGRLTDRLNSIIDVKHRLHAEQMSIMQGEVEQLYYSSSVNGKAKCTIHTFLPTQEQRNIRSAVCKSNKSEHIKTTKKKRKCKHNESQTKGIKIVSSERPANSTTKQTSREPYGNKFKSSSRARSNESQVQGATVSASSEF